MLHRHVWYVILNGHSARILQDLNETYDPGHREIRIVGQDLHRRDTLSDKPTRSFASAGGGRRSAVEPGTDPLTNYARALLGKVFDKLEAAQRKAAFDEIVVIAPPDMIGLWRQEIPAQLKPVAKREIIRNLMNTPSDELIPAIRELTEGPDHAR